MPGGVSGPTTSVARACGVGTAAGSVGSDPGGVPPLTANPSGDDAPYWGTTYEYNANAGGGSGSYTYAWSGTNATFPDTDTTAAVNVIWTAIGAQTLSVTVTDAVTADFVSVDFNLTVQEPVAITAGAPVVTAGTNPTNVGENVSFALSVAPSGGDGLGYHYAWKVDGDAAPGGTDADTYGPTTFTAGTFTVTCTITDTYGTEYTTAELDVDVYEFPLESFADLHAYIDGTDLTVSWNSDATNTTGFDVYVNASLVGSGASPAIVIGGSVAVPDDTVTVRALNAGPGYDESDPVTAYALPAAPTGLAVVGIEGYLGAGWTPPGETVSGYLVKIDGGVVYDHASVDSSLNFADAQVALASYAGTTVDVTVAAYADPGGLIVGPDSTAASLAVPAAAPDGAFNVQPSIGPDGDDWILSWEFTDDAVPIEAFNVYLNGVLYLSAVSSGANDVGIVATTGDQVYLRAYNELGYVQSDDATVPA